MRADMILRGGNGAGFVFSVGSIAWTGCLGGDDANPVARITENVLRAFERPDPFGEASTGG
jgi:N,N-dimethylformamidase